MPLFAGESVLAFPRRLVPRFGKVLIAASAASAVGDQDALARGGKISDGRALIVEAERRRCRPPSGRLTVCQPSQLSART